MTIFVQLDKGAENSLANHLQTYAKSTIGILQASFSTLTIEEKVHTYS